MTADKSDSERRPCSSTFKDMLLWPLLHAIKDWLEDISGSTDDGLDDLVLCDGTLEKDIRWQLPYYDHMRQ